jgi:hypothetical protein
VRPKEFLLSDVRGPVPLRDKMICFS